MSLIAASMFNQPLNGGGPPPFNPCATYIMPAPTVIPSRHGELLVMQPPVGMVNNLCAEIA